MTVISRVQWGARVAAKAEPLDATQVIGIAVHWPAMAKPLRGVAAVSAGLRGWQAFHMDGKGWRDIAYQVAVDQDGNRYELRGLDGQSAANGDVDVNLRYGAVLAVLAPGEQPTDAMMAELRNVVRDHRALFPRSKVVVGHVDVRPEPTECPGSIMLALVHDGSLEPGPTPAQLLREELRAAIDATLRAKRRTDEPRRPKIRFQIDRALDALRKARGLNGGDQ